MKTIAVLIKFKKKTTNFNVEIISYQANWKSCLDLITSHPEYKSDKIKCVF